MKRNILTVISLMVLFLFSSCGYDPVFYGIMKDVAPEEATISGNITSIARCKVGSTEYLFLSTGGTLWYKPITSAVHGEWQSYSVLPFEGHQYSNSEGHTGQQIMKVAADENSIYLLTTNFRTDNEYGIVLPDTFHLWVKDLSNFFTSGNTWKNITQGKESTFFKTVYNSEDGQFETYFSIFFTNSPKAEHRKAYFSVQTPGSSSVTYYELKGQSDPELKSNITASNYIKTNSNSTKVNAAFFLEDQLYFTDANIVSTNETGSSDATVVCLAGVDSNYNSTADLYCLDSTNPSPAKRLTLDSTIASLAFTANSLLVGKGSFSSTYTTDGGIDRILLNNEGKPETKTSEFTNNAKYQFTSSYILFTLLCADPSKEEANACIYTTISYRGTGSSSSASPKNVGLWSYYPSRGNWNRE